MIGMVLCGACRLQGGTDCTITLGETLHCLDKYVITKEKNHESQKCQKAQEPTTKQLLHDEIIADQQNNDEDDLMRDLIYKNPEQSRIYRYSVSCIFVLYICALSFVTL